MESRNDLYVSLPSNSSFKYFPNNTIANFKVTLVKPTHLNGRYEVALTEMYFSRIWFNVVGNEANVNFHMKDRESFTVALDEGYYAEPEIIIESYNSQLKHIWKQLEKNSKKTKLLILQL